MLKRVSYFSVKMDLPRGDGRGTPNRRQAPHAPRDKDGDGGKKKQRVVDMKLDVFHNPDLLAYPGWGAAAAAMVSSHGHEVCRIPPLRPLVATHFTRTTLQIEGCKILAS